MLFFCCMEFCCEVSMQHFYVLGDKFVAIHSQDLEILEDNDNLMVDMSVEIAWDMEGMFRNIRKEKCNPLVICGVFLLPVQIFVDLIVQAIGIWCLFLHLQLQVRNSCCSILPVSVLLGLLTNLLVSSKL